MWGTEARQLGSAPPLALVRVSRWRREGGWGRAVAAAAVGRRGAAAAGAGGGRLRRGGIWRRPLCLRLCLGRRGKMFGGERV